MNEKIVSALSGLMGAYGNSGKSPDTDKIVGDALLHCFSEGDMSDAVSEIVEEKYRLSPDCRICLSPCGNTSDYDMTLFYADKSLACLKEEMLSEAAALVGRLRDGGKTELPEEIYRALSLIRYDLEEETYKEMIEILKQAEV